MSSRGLDRNSGHCRQLHTRDSVLKGAMLGSQEAAVLEMGLPRLVKVMGEPCGNLEERDPEAESQLNLSTSWPV